MNTLFKLTLVSVAVLQSGLIAAGSAQANEVVFLEETKAIAANDTISPVNNTVFSFTETVVSPGTAVNQPSTTSIVANEGTPIVSKPVEEVFFLEETTVDSAKTSINETEFAFTETVVVPEAAVLEESIAANDEAQILPAVPTTESVSSPEPKAVVMLPASNTVFSFTETVVSPGTAVSQPSTTAIVTNEVTPTVSHPVEEVVFLEESTVEPAKATVRETALTLTETIVVPDAAAIEKATAANDETQTLPPDTVDLSDTVVFSETPAPVEVPEALKSNVELPAVGIAEVIVNSATAEPTMTERNASEISFTESIGDTLKAVRPVIPVTPPVTDSPAVMVQTAERDLGESIGELKSNTNSEVVFAEEPQLAAARPVRRQLLKSPEELEALREQIRRKAGTSAFASKAERNSLAVLREAQETADTRQQQGRLILLTNVEVEGNTVIDDATLAKVSEPFVGRRIMLSDLEELRVRLTNTYIENGYINSGVILPDQKVENGNLVYNVIEGELVDINIEGEGSLREKYITDRVLVGAVKPFNSFALQENFQLLLDDPLFDRMDGKLRALPGRGGSVLDLDVTRARPYDFSVTTSNHGTPSLGAEQIFLSGVVRNISGFGDELGITVGGNGSKFNITTEYEIPIRSDDTRVNVRLTAADSSVVEEPLDTIDIESNSLGAEISVTRPFERSIKKSVIAGVGLAMRKSKNTLEGEPFSFSPGEENGRSKVTVARLWQEYVLRGDVDVFAARGTLNMGLDMFGSTAYDDDRPDSDFVSAQAQLQYARRIFEERAQVIVRLEGQIASRELLPLERFSLGGANTVRGYRENELVRDQAIMASAEMRIPFFKSPNFGTFQFAPFVDFGYARNKTFFINDELLASAGMGLLWDYGAHMSGELYFGAGLKDGERPEQEDLQDRGVHLKIVAKF